jgi:hypothetical protein
MAWLYLCLAFLFGLLVGRWWAVAAAIPVAVAGAFTAPPDLQELEGWLAGVFIAVPIATGILLRWAIRRLSHGQTL